MISMLEDARNIARRGGWIMGGLPPSPASDPAIDADKAFAMIRLGIDTRSALGQALFASERKVDYVIGVLTRAGKIERFFRSGKIAYKARS